MRTCLVISVVIHAAFLLWLVLGPGAEAFDPANAEPILVELVAPQDVPREADKEPQKSADPQSQDPQSQGPKSEPARPEPTRTAVNRPPKPETPKPEPLKPEPQTAKPSPEADQKPAPHGIAKTAVNDSLEERAATAARLAWLLDLPTDTVTSLAAPPSENKSKLSDEEVAQFKAQVSRCWVSPDGVPNTPGFDVRLRVALTPGGRLGAAPELIQAPASLAGPPLVDSAKRALQKCQPYGGLPPDKYKDWKILDLTFTAQGPTGLAGPPAGKSAAAR